VPRLTEALADPRSHLIPRPVDLVRDQVNDPGQLRQRSDRAVVGDELCNVGELVEVIRWRSSDVLGEVEVLERGIA
jgi:hypothetical protein